MTTDLSSLADTDLLDLLARAIRGAGNAQRFEAPPRREEIANTYRAPAEPHYVVWLSNTYDRRMIVGVPVQNEAGQLFEIRFLAIGPNYLPASKFDGVWIDSAMRWRESEGLVTVIPPGVEAPLTDEMRRGLFARVATPMPDETTEDRIFLTEQALRHVRDFSPAALDPHCTGHAYDRAALETELERLRVSARDLGRKANDRGLGDA